HSFYAKAYDAAGNSATSASTTVTVSNGALAPLQFKWQGDFHGTGSDQAIANAIMADHQGNVVVAGQFRGTINFGGGSVSSVGGNFGWDAFVAKYSSSGKYLWAKTYGSASDDQVYGLAIDSANNIIITGGFSSTVSFGATTLTSGTTQLYSQNIFLAKLEPSQGNCTWAKGFLGAGNSYGNGVGVDASDRIVMGGTFSGAITIGANSLASAGSFDVFVAKVSSDGNTVLWAKRHGGTGADYMTALAVDSAGDVATAGYFSGSIDLGGGGQSAGGSTDIFVAKYSGLDGSWKWSKVFGASGSDAAYGIATHPRTGNVLVTGAFNGTVDLSNGSSGGGVLVA